MKKGTPRNRIPPSPGGGYPRRVVGWDHVKILSNNNICSIPAGVQELTTIFPKIIAVKSLDGMVMLKFIM